MKLKLEDGTVIEGTKEECHEFILIWRMKTGSRNGIIVVVEEK